MAETVVGETDDLSFVADTTHQVQEIYDAYRAGKLPMTGELAAALSQAREQLVAIKLDGSKHPEAADQRIAACVQIVEMRATTSDSSLPASAPPVWQPEMQAMPATVGSSPAVWSPPLPYSYQAPANQQPPPAPVGWQQSAWSASPPSAGTSRNPRFSLFRVVAAVVGIFAIGIAVPKVAVLLLHKGSSSSSTAVHAGASPTSPTIALPALESLLYIPPASGFVLDRQAALNGYLSQAQIELYLGSGLPPSVRVYAATWVGPNGVVGEEAILTPSATDADEFAKGIFNSTVAKGGRSFDIPTISGAAEGATIPTASNQKAKALAIVARSNVAILLIAVGTEPDAAKTLAIQAAQTTGTSVPVDPGPL